jgi:hypothetical protein
LHQERSQAYVTPVAFGLCPCLLLLVVFGGQFGFVAPVSYQALLFYAVFPLPSSSGFALGCSCSVASSCHAVALSVLASVGYASGAVLRLLVL